MDPEWWQSAVVYQIYPRSFADADGDGVGDLAGIRTKLDYLHRLGVDVLWLSPVYPSPQDDAGYDISDYRAIDPVFGTLEEFDAMLGEVHDRGMKLIMDLVVNHTSDEHPWFEESRADTDKRAWYWWRPPRPGTVGGTPGAEPNNWASFFSGPAWEWDESSGEYYLHLFSRKQPDLNWENPQVRQAIYDMMRWWLDRGVDGFRMDVINLISKVVDLPDGEPIDSGPLGDGTPFVMCGPRIHEFIHEMHEHVFTGREELLTVGEMPGVTVEDARLFTNPARGEVDMVFQFEHVDLDHATTKWRPIPLSLLDLKDSFGRWQTGLAEIGWNSLYWNNHDQPRAVSRFGSEDPEHRELAAKLLATVLHLHRGTPYVFQGEELGMTNAEFASVDDLRDIESLNRWAVELSAGMTEHEFLDIARRKSRDNARTPMQWDSGPQAGFTTGTPWLSVNTNHAQINAARQVDDPDSVFAHYQAVIALRHDEPVVALGDFTMLLTDDPTVYAFTRRLGDVQLLVAANFSSDRAKLSEVPDGWSGTSLLLGNYPDRGDDAVLRPWEARIYRRTTGSRHQSSSERC